MKVYYHQKHDLLYITLKEANKVRNERFKEDIVFDIDKDDKIVGIEILVASTYFDRQKYFYCDYRTRKLEPVYRIYFLPVNIN